MAKKKTKTAINASSNSKQKNKDKDKSKNKNKDSDCRSVVAQLPPLLSKSHLTNNTVVEELYEGAVYVVRNFFSQDECKAWVHFVSSTQKMDFVSHPQSRTIAHRECFRWQRNDWDYSEKLWERMQSLLSQKIAPHFHMPPGYQPTACNGNLRLYRYDQGMSFGKHIDGTNTTQKGNTEVTVLIYLTDCQGGATRFYPPSRKNKSFAFDPQAGAILFHIHGDRCLEHEADPVQKGVKYVLRTDLIYNHL